jgi:hypothetical protein
MTLIIWQTSPPQTVAGLSSYLRSLGREMPGLFYSSFP